MKVIKFFFIFLLEGFLAVIISAVFQWPFRWLFACLTPPRVLFPDDVCANFANFAFNSLFYFLLIVSIFTILYLAMRKVF